MKLVDALSKALLETILFFEFSDDSIVNLDAAMSQMEQIASILQHMEEDAKEDFLEFCFSMAQEYKDMPDQFEFIMNIGETLGLIH
jgi:hypothetical protein